MISIIIPTYNRASVLERTLPSYLVQKDVGEILIVDDGSTDSTRDLVKKFQHDPRVKYIAHPTRQGGPKARLTGIEYSHGDFILFGEDDLIFDDNYAESLMKHLTQNHADVSGGRIIYLGKNEGFEEGVTRMNRVRTPVIDFNTLEGNFGVKLDHCIEVPFVHACFLARREKIRGIDLDLTYLGNGYREETDLQISMLKDGCKIIFCSDALCYHLHRSTIDIGGQHSRGALYYLFWTIKNNGYFLHKHYDFLKRDYALKPKIILEGYMLVRCVKIFFLTILGKLKNTCLDILSR
jgi:glycosyltransferase involved in cell wall biosynthesis